MNVPIEWMEYAKSLGVPTILVVAAYYVLPKVWTLIQQRSAIANQQNDLAHAGLAGVNEVVTTLRSQLVDMNSQLDTFRIRLKEMEATLQKAVEDKMNAEQGEAIAKNDLFNANLYIKKLIAQIKSLGASPVDQ